MVLVKGSVFVHLNNFKKIGVKVESLYDPDEENREFFKKEIGYDVKVFESDEYLIKNSKIDGVIICSLHCFHFIQIKRPLKMELMFLLKNQR
ncbi:MAG: Gfo/Idh/MocA family oxidoreductase [Candidatus Omnitrophica bacterium]|nr:Gfo/Idh/MocA family oxidoreductase [Candidatus Omnitrophota bacterium]